jgi:[methyl-Co(III) methanol-specific corrinoid protein]:coenzyme M methyltransferase
MSTLTAKDRVLKFLNGEEVDRPPIFSGMGNVVVPVLEKYKINFAMAHRDPELMAKAAAGMYREEALGSVMNYYEDVEGLLYPTVKEKVIKTADDVHFPDDIANAGRIPVVAEAIRILRKEIGDEVAIGTYILGPFTLGGQVKELDELFEESFLEPEKTAKLLEKLSEFIIKVFKVYQEAGVDYFTLREMGGTSDVMSPKSFKSLIKPHLVRIISEMPRPNILHICGDTNSIIEDMGECGANAISVDQKNRLPESREKLGHETIILGNFDPVKVLMQGKAGDVGPTARGCLDAGANAVWPGCDLWPEVPEKNMQALMDSLKSK